MNSIAKLMATRQSLSSFLRGLTALSWEVQCVAAEIAFEDKLSPKSSALHAPLLPWSSKSSSAVRPSPIPTKD